MDPNPGGPNLWAHLSPEEIKELIKFSAGELRVVHALKRNLPQERFRYDPKLEAEIKFRERAHDTHFFWLTESIKREQARTARR